MRRPLTLIAAVLSVSAATACGTVDRDDDRGVSNDLAVTQACEVFPLDEARQVLGPAVTLLRATSEPQRTVPGLKHSGCTYQVPSGRGLTLAVYTPKDLDAERAVRHAQERLGGEPVPGYGNRAAFHDGTELTVYVGIRSVHIVVERSVDAEGRPPLAVAKLVADRVLPDL